MRILFVSNLYPPNTVGGYERLCGDVAAELARRNHRISVLTSDHGGKEERYPRQSVERSLRLTREKGDINKPLACPADELARIHAHNVRVVERKLADERPDIVFVWNLLFTDASLLNAVRDARLKTVFLLTDFWMTLFYNAKFMKYYLAEQLYPHTITDIDRFKTEQRLIKCKRTSIPGRAIFASEFMRRLHTEAGLGFSDSTVIHHGVNSSPIGDFPSVDRSGPVQAPELRLLYAGRVTYVKGVHTAIQAVPAVIQALPELRVKLTILGLLQDQPYLESVRQLIARTGLTDHIEFRPPVEETKLFDVFLEHDLYLFTSLYEPFALTLIHALRAGIPAIVSDAGGNTEMVRHRENGLLYAKGDPGQLAAAIVELGRDRLLCQTLSRAAQQHASEYTVERMVDRVEAYLASGR